MAQKDVETIVQGLHAETKARFVGLFDFHGNAIAAVGDLGPVCDKARAALAELQTML